MLAHLLSTLYFNRFLLRTQEIRIITHFILSHMHTWQKSQNVFELKAGTLYPLLHSMEEKGLLSVYEQSVLGKTRKYYSITNAGRGVLQKKTEEWQEYTSAVTRVLAMEV